MKINRLLFLGILLFLATISRGVAGTSYVTASLENAFRPIQQRIGKDSVDLAPNADGSVHLWYHELETTADKKLFGPAADGFILEASLIGDPTQFKPSLHPFARDDYPRQEKYPWFAEFHLYPITSGLWLVVSMWCGFDTDKALVQEVVAATAKSAEASRKFSLAVSGGTTHRLP